MTLKGVVTFGEEYKLSDILPLDALLFLAYTEGWKLSDKFTKVRFVPLEHYGVNYPLPIDWSKHWDKPTIDMSATPAINIGNATMRKIADDEHRVWKVGYAPELNVLYVGTGRDGQICFNR